MTTSITVSATIVDDHYQITASVNPGSTLPAEIFIHLNTGVNSLGSYYGICSLDELTRLPIFSGTAIPVFGNRFVRYREAKISVPLSSNIPAIISTMKNSISLLQVAYSGFGTSTQIITV